jgi:hypothetical protein
VTHDTMCAMATVTDDASWRRSRAVGGSAAYALAHATTDSMPLATDAATVRPSRVLPSTVNRMVYDVETGLVEPRPC